MRGQCADGFGDPCGQGRARRRQFSHVVGREIGGDYWRTAEAGGKVDKGNPTQVGRALAQLGIDLLPAYSPQALDSFLADPRAYAPATKMAFAGIAEPGERADVVACLRTLVDGE